MQEIWLPVEGYEGLYEISNLGRVKSLRCGSERVLNPSIDSGGYAYNVLRKNKIPKNFLIHRLVAIAFIEKDETYQIQVNHKNNIRTDNRVDNLEWCSARENYCHRSLFKKLTSKYPGVYLSKQNRWLSQISIDRKVYYLGSFDTEQEAYQARINYELNNNIKNKYL